MLQGTAYLPVGTRVTETERALETINEIIKETVREDERVAVYTRCGKGDNGMEQAMRLLDEVLPVVKNGASPTIHTKLTPALTKTGVNI